VILNRYKFKKLRFRDILFLASLFLVVFVIGFSKINTVNGAPGTPVATGVSITGTPNVAQVLTGSYLYTDTAGAWQNVGVAGFSTGIALYSTLAIDNSNIPYLAYTDYANGNKPTVKKFDGANWVLLNLNSAVVSMSSAFFIDFTIDDTTDVPYIAYENFNFLPNVSKATVKKYDSSAVGNEIQVLVATPASIQGPSAGTYTISFDDDGAGPNPVQTTAVLNYNANAVTIQAALEALTNIGAGNIIVYKAYFSVWPISLEFRGALAGLPQQLVTVDATDLCMGPIVDMPPPTCFSPATVTVSEEQLGGTTGTWINVGTPGFSDGDELAYTSIAMDDSSVPYVAYQDFNNPLFKATVKTFDGANWVDMGNSHFSAGTATNTSISLDSTGTPYVAYKDTASGDQATVMKYNSGTWVQVGGSVSTTTVNRTDLVVNKTTNIPYLAYIETGGFPQRAIVKKFDGANWVLVGSMASQALDSADELSFAINDDGILYVAYMNDSNVKAVVRKYDSGTDTWVNVGSPYFSEAIGSLSLAIDSNGVPYVGYRDESIGGKATVMKYDSDQEGTSTYKWFRDGTEIVGETGATYTVLSSDQGKLIKFEVTPISQTPVTGTPVQSAEVLINSYPVATTVTANGTAYVGETLTGSYTFSDVDTDTEGTSTFKWYRDGVEIPGVTNITYTLTSTDDGKTIKFGVTPVASSGSTPGVEVQSAGTLISQQPSGSSGSTGTPDLPEQEEPPTCEELGNCPPTLPPTLPPTYTEPENPPTYTEPENPPTYTELEITPTYTEPENPPFTQEPEASPTIAENSITPIVFASPIQNFLNENFYPETIEKLSVSLKLTTIFATLIGIIASLASILFLNPLSFNELILIPFRLWSLLLTALGLRKKVKPWGTVYDSITKQPLDPVYVSLVNLEGEEIASSITDLDGRYGFFTDPGVYKVVPKKTNYIFPSNALSNHFNDEFYQDLYFGDYMNIGVGQIITNNIPMDPINFDWNEFAKNKKQLFKFYSKKELIIARISNILFSFGFTVSAISLIVSPEIFNIIVFGLYILMFILRRTKFKLKAKGRVFDKDGTPMSYSFIKVFSVATNVEISHKVIDKFGRYHILIPNGNYYVKIEKKNDDGTYSLVHTSEPFEVKHGTINKVFNI